MALLAASAATQAAATAAQAGGAPEAVAAGHPRVTNPYAPSYRHLYRRGAVPTRGAAARMAGWARQHPAAVTSSPAATSSPTAANSVEPTSANNVRYGGGNDGIGVTTGDERVYLVFFGSQWGTTGTDGNGDTTLSGDPSGQAPYLQEMFKGLGTGGEQWSGVMTQYCEGVSAGAQTCPAAAPHVAYPHGGALAGVWVDESAASPAPGDRSPARAGGDQRRHPLRQHDGRLEPGRPVRHPVPAWHPPRWVQHPDRAGLLRLARLERRPHPQRRRPVRPPTVTSRSPTCPTSPTPAVNCGQNFVRSGSAGNLDGVSIVAGHEYAETITDQNPAGGWFDLGGEEAADKCAWQQTGTGKVALLTLPTETFAMQGFWANNANSGKGGCRFTQTIKRTQLLRNAGFETGKLTPWVATAGVLKKKASSFPVHAGNWLVRLGGRTAPHTDTLAQTVTVAPAGGTYGAATFSFWLEIKTNDPASKASDTLTVQVLDASGTVVKQTLHVYSNLDAVGHYVQRSFSLNSFLGQTIVLKFTGTQTLSGHSTSFLIDDTALNAS